MRKFLLILSILISIKSFAQEDSTDLNDKYWSYRFRLVSEFVRVGEGKGKSICAAGIVQDGKRVSMYYGDNITYHGWYIGTLATELAVLQRAGANYELTKAELYYALEAVNRLDLVAETFFKDSLGKPGKPELNGFFVRDDVDQSHKDMFDGIDYVYSDYLLGESTLDRPQSDNEMSQDQAIHLLLGLRLTEHYLNDSISYQGVSIRKMACDMAIRIISWISRDHWTVKNPVLNKPVYRGPSAKLFSYAFAKASENFNFGKRPKSVSKPAALSGHGFRLLQTGFVPVFFNRTMILNLATISNFWGGKRLTNDNISWYDLLWEKEAFPLIHADLNGLKRISSYRVSEKRIRKLLETAHPCENKSFGPRSWNTSNRWLASRKTYKSYDGFFSERNNTGLDYMILSNMFFLHYNPQDSKQFHMPIYMESTLKNQILKYGKK